MRRNAPSRGMRFEMDAMLKHRPSRAELQPPRSRFAQGMRCSDEPMAAGCGSELQPGRNEETVLARID